MGLADSDICVVITTFGTSEWEMRGEITRVKTREAQTVQPYVLHWHEPAVTLSEARNNAVAHLDTDDVYDHLEWIVFLDADDELDPYFTQALAAYDGPGEILQTCVQGFVDVVVQEGCFSSSMRREWLDPFPMLHRQKWPLHRQNYLTIGSPIRRDMFNEVGGFDEWPVLEDWALWLKCDKAGAQFDEIPDAIYYINDDHTRSRTLDNDEIARQIRAHYR